MMKIFRENSGLVLQAVCRAAFLLLIAPALASSQPPASSRESHDWWDSSRPGLLSGDREMEPPEKSRRLVVRRVAIDKGSRLDLDLPLLCGVDRREAELFYGAVIRRFRGSLPELGRPLGEMEGKDGFRGAIRLTAFQSLGDLLSLEFAREWGGEGDIPDEERLGLNWSFALARELALKDLFRPNAAYPEALAQACTDELRRRFPPADREYPPKWYRRGITGTEGEQGGLRRWAIAKDSLVFLFDERDLAGQFEAGPQKVEIPFSLIVGLLDPAGPLGWAAAGGAAESGCLNLSCHRRFPSDWKAAHPAMGKGCGACHPPYLAGRLHPMKRPVGPVCLSCHTAMGEKLVEARSIHAPVRSGNCTSCHDPHGVNGPMNHRLLKVEWIIGSVPNGTFDVPRSIAGLCPSCHPHVMRDIPLAATPTGFRAGTRNLHSSHAGKDKTGSCTVCHAPHAASRALLINEDTPLGKEGWAFSINFRPTGHGGACRPGCHRQRIYSRRSPVKMPR